MDGGLCYCIGSSDQENLLEKEMQNGRVAVTAGPLSVAKRRYPKSEVRGSGQECQAGTAQEWPRGATLVQGQGREPGAATLLQRPGAAAGRRHPMAEARGGGWEGQPTSKEQWLHWRRWA